MNFLFIITATMIFTKNAFAFDKSVGQNKTNGAISLDDAGPCGVDARFEKFFHRKSTFRESCPIVCFGPNLKKEEFHYDFKNAQSTHLAEFLENEDFLLPTEKCLDGGFGNRKEYIFFVFICDNIVCISFALLLIWIKAIEMPFVMNGLYKFKFKVRLKWP